MRTVIIPVDETLLSDQAIRAVAAQARQGMETHIHLLSVQTPLDGYASRFLNGKVIRDYQRDQGEKILSGVRRVLDRAGVPYTAHIRVGEAAVTVATLADEVRADEIVVGAEGGWWASFMLWLVVSRIRRYANVPVVMVMAPRQTAQIGRPVAGFGSSYPR